MIERCQDYRRIKRLYPHEVMVSSELYYLVECEGGEDLGLWIFQPINQSAYMHAHMGEKCRGKKALESCRNAMRWVFENTKFRKIYAATEVRAAQIMAVLVGMRYVYNVGSWRVYATES